MTDSPFDDFLSTLDFGEITGPTLAEEARDALEQRDLSKRLALLLRADAHHTLKGSSPAERDAWRDAADFVLGTLSQRRESSDAGGVERSYELTSVRLYAVLIKSICTAYRAIDVSVVNAAAAAVLALHACEIDSEVAGAWQNNVQPVALTQHTVIRLAMQAAYIYSDLHPTAELQ